LISQIRTPYDHRFGYGSIRISTPGKQNTIANGRIWLISQIRTPYDHRFGYGSIRISPPGKQNTIADGGIWLIWPIRTLLQFPLIE